MENITQRLAKAALRRRCAAAVTSLRDAHAACGGILEDTLPHALLQLARRRLRQRRFSEASPAAIFRLLAAEVSRAQLAALHHIAVEAECSLARYPGILGLDGHLSRNPWLTLTEEYLREVRAYGASRRIDVVENSTAPIVRPKFFTSSQAEVMERALAMGTAFFTGRRMSPFRPRLFPLLIGPTGSGKTRIFREVAQRLGAEPLVFATGDWVPLGASSEFEPSSYAILGALAQNERVAVLIDELDKFNPDFSNGWTRGVAAELWRLLDHDLPISGFMRSAAGRTCVLEPGALRDKISRVWIAGAGTWQDAHSRGAIGFVEKALPDPVRDGALVPPELLLRFHPKPLHLRYPSADETATILLKSGLADLAKQLGIALDPALVDWSKGGIRALEAISAELVIADLDRKVGHER